MDMPKKNLERRLESILDDAELCSDHVDTINDVFDRLNLVNELIESSREFLDQPNFNSASASKSATRLQAAIHKIKALEAE